MEDDENKKNPMSTLLKWIAKHAWAILGISGSLIVLVIGIAVMIVLIFMSGQNSSCSPDNSNNSNETITDVDTGKIPKGIFDHLTKNMGFSGAGAAGAVAVAKRESGFNPKITNPSGGVAGLFQWSGWGNNINGNRITTGGFIQSGDDSTLTFENEMKLVDYELKHSYKAAADTVGKANDAGNAALDWSKLYEGVSNSDGQTKVSQIVSDARGYYEKFGGSSISSDPSLSGATDTADVGSDSSASNCSSSSTGSVEDGTGTHKEANGSDWKEFSQLPDDIKKYAHDPAQLLGKRGDGSKWVALGGSSVSADQCVGFTVAYGDIIWGLQGNKNGNGIDMANSFAGDTHTKTISSPKAGAIASQDGYGGNPAGHTFIIEHVYSDGSVLLSEQNWTKSGQTAGEKYTWDFRLSSKAELQRNHTKYDYPGDNSKYKLKW